MTKTMTATTVTEPGQAMAEGRETVMMQRSMLKQTKETGRGQATGWLSRYVLGGLLALMLLPLARAETLTIGKGSGIVWSGLPFSGSWNGPVLWDYAGGWGILYVSLDLGPTTTSGLNCMPDSAMTTIAGYKVYQIAPGVGIIPRATGTAQYTVASKPSTPETMTATIGLPETKGMTSTGHNITSPVRQYNYHWCVPIRDDMTVTTDDTRVIGSAPRTASMSGDWVIVANGTQTSREVTLPAAYGGTPSGDGRGVLRSIIFPTNITLRVSNLTCTVVTTKQINFGNVERNTTVNSELASRTYPLVVSCSQDTDRINANINVQFGPLSGLYGGNRYRLALAEGNGYITGEIDNGVTSSGACNLNTGIPFDNTQIKVGNILATDTSKTFSNQVTWRLCSGGANLPTGPVTASAEMLVTFN